MKRRSLAGMLAALVLLPTGLPAMAASRVETVLTGLDQDEHPDLKGVIVMRDGRVLAERYYNGAGTQTLHDIRSAGKSVTALAMGIAIDQGKVAGDGVTVERYWPAAKGTALDGVPLADILTMRSGLAAFDEDPASPGSEDKMDEAVDPHAFILSIPRADWPGTRYRYNSVTSTVAGIIVAKATGRTMADVAGSHLFAPLGITSWRWDADANGYTKGQGNLWLTLRGTAAIGEMVRQGGVWQGRRVISHAWVDKALSPLVAIAADDRYADAYGYFWYAKSYGVGGRNVTVHFASGNGGNKIYVVPDLDLVIAVHSAAYGKGYGQRRSETILKAILEAL